jgi:hypothetical protein
MVFTIGGLLIPRNEMNQTINNHAKNLLMCILLIDSHMACFR